MFSKAASSFVSYAGDATGWFKPVESVGREAETRLLTTEYFLAVTCNLFIFFCYVIHPNSMTPSLMRTFDRAMALNNGEKRLLEWLRAISEMDRN